MASPGTALAVMTGALAARFGIEGQSTELVDILKQTAFKLPQGKVATDAQMTALLIVAKQYGLNPFTKEIYAFEAKGGGIAPIVGVDGWARMINDHPAFDGMEFRYADNSVEIGGHKTFEWIECVIYRRDRTRPTVIREFFTEVFRGGGEKGTPWDTHPARFNRHKAMIQCGRVAFGFTGVTEADEAGVDVIDGSTGEVRQQAPAPAPAAPRRASESRAQQAPVDVQAREVQPQAPSSPPPARPAQPAQPAARADIDEDGVIGDGEPLSEWTGTSITPGQRKYLQQQFDSLKLHSGTVTEILLTAGVGSLDDQILTSQFDAIRAKLREL
jgi:phage recombination protein Bet